METTEIEDDDPRCVCGTHLSEHMLCGCEEGFQTASEWAAERESIRESVFAEMYNQPYEEDQFYEDDQSIEENQREEDERVYQSGLQPPAWR
jgi:hypothetical protein